MLFYRMAELITPTCAKCGKRAFPWKLKNYIGNGLFHQECFEMWANLNMRFWDDYDKVKWVKANQWDSDEISLSRRGIRLHKS